MNALVPDQIHEVGDRCAGEHGDVEGSGGSSRVSLRSTGVSRQGSRVRGLVCSETVLQPPGAWFRLELVENETHLIDVRSDNS